VSGSQFVYVTYIRTTPEKLWHGRRERENDMSGKLNVLGLGGPIQWVSVEDHAVLDGRGG
jgi:hypothetical protein